MGLSRVEFVRLQKNRNGYNNMATEIDSIWYVPLLGNISLLRFANVLKVSCATPEIASFKKAKNKDPNNFYQC